MVIPSVCDECSFLFEIIICCHPILISIVLFILFYHSSFLLSRCTLELYDYILSKLVGVNTHILWILFV